MTDDGKLENRNYSELTEMGVVVNVVCILHSVIWFILITIWAGGFAF